MRCWRLRKIRAGAGGIFGDAGSHRLEGRRKAAGLVPVRQCIAPELVQLSRLEDRQMLITAEKRLKAGDPKGAQELAQQAIDKKIGDQGGRCSFWRRSRLRTRIWTGRATIPEGDP